MAIHPRYGGAGFRSVPNVTLGPVPYTPIFTNVKKPNMYSLDEQPPKPKKSRSNLMDSGPDEPRRQRASAGGAGNIDNRALSESRGYEQGEGNIGGLGMLLGAATGIPFVGGAIEKGLDAAGLPGNYGDYGTTDAQGNVFGSEGRAYDPVTGQAVGSYGSSADAKNAVLGGYQNLRDAGLGPVEAGIGSYENSIYNYGATADPATHAAARAARLRGGASGREGIVSTANLINQNTGLEGGVAPVGSLAAAETYGQEPAFTPITGQALGFDNTRAFSANQASQNTGKWGTGQGDLAATNFGPGVINESGQIEHGGGTVVSLKDTSTPGGGQISLLADSAAGKARANEELQRRAGQTPVRSPDQIRNEQNESGGGGGGGGK